MRNGSVVRRAVGDLLSRYSLRCRRYPCRHRCTVRHRLHGCRNARCRDPQPPGPSDRASAERRCMRPDLRAHHHTSAVSSMTALPGIGTTDLGISRAGGVATVLPPLPGVSTAGAEERRNGVSWLAPAGSVDGWGATTVGEASGGVAHPHISSIKHPILRAGRNRRGGWARDALPCERRNVGRAGQHGWRRTRAGY